MSLPVGCAVEGAEAGPAGLSLPPQLADDGSARPWLRRALALARRGAGLTSPNPAVGAVVVRDGRVVGEGFHRRAGGPHAEVVALAQAGELARGATLVVTLEPCDHWGRTPPCTEAILRAGVARVVACTVDPNPRVRGRGFARLQDAGVEVLLAPPWAAQRARALNEAYEKYITTGIPYVTCKAAMSLDGKIAATSGQARWITGPQARRLAHRLRALHDAVMVGVGTVLADDPMLNARPGRRAPARQPLRVVVDSLARTPPDAALFHPVGPTGPVLVAATQRAPAGRVAALRDAGAEVLLLPADDHGRVDLRELLAALGRRAITSILVEGGGTLHAALLEAGLVDRVAVFIAPKILGGQHAPTFVEGQGCASVEQAWPVVSWHCRRLPGGELFVEGRVQARPTQPLGVGRQPAWADAQSAAGPRWPVLLTAGVARL
ncbi:MAG TPA: bifunctional diaminohydroxyphosphoribosylaminopyrimidine deaminase/5-amino-6-(5-phosphoribosylamino)uracil reductase RibD [Limnochordales bacterium]